MWSEVQDLFGDARFEIRFSWTARAACGDAVGWLLAETAPTADAAAALQRGVDRAAAAALQRIAGQRSAIAADLLERLTHRLRTDVSTLQAVAEGALQGMFDAAETDEVLAEVRGVGAEAQRQLSAMREVMTALDPATPRSEEPLVTALERELEAAGAAALVRDDGGEGARTWMPGSGWSACARILAAAADGDIVVAPDPGGWAVTAQTLADVTHAGAIAIAAGGSATAERTGDRRIRVRLTIPAAPSG
jgi:hypothetical protein